MACPESGRTCDKQGVGDWHCQCTTVGIHFIGFADGEIEMAARTDRNASDSARRTASTTHRCGCHSPRRSTATRISSRAGPHVPGRPVGACLVLTAAIRRADHQETFHARTACGSLGILCAEKALAWRRARDLRRAGPARRGGHGWRCIRARNDEGRCVPQRLRLEDSVRILIADDDCSRDASSRRSSQSRAMW